MKTVGIIAEYNPFHKGHAYHLQKAKELTGADFCIIVMSGNFVQRGLPAILDKYARAEAALRCGADLVLELPVPYATGSAEYFAQGAVALLDSLGVVDALCFGSECGNLSELLPFARLFEEEPEEYQQLLRLHLKRGCTFPEARSLAAEELLHYSEHIPLCSDPDLSCRAASAVLEEPNNTLGIEYCKALLHRRSAIKPVTLKRRSAGYHDASLDAELASATAIRRELFRSETLSPTLRSQLPEASLEIMNRAKGFVRFEDFSLLLYYRLLSTSQKDLASVWDMGEDLAARIYNRRFSFTTAPAFADELKTRQLTHTRITRALCHLLLDLKTEDMSRLKDAGYPVYPRVLGFRKSAAPLLSSIKRNGTSPLLVKAADASQILNADQTVLFEKDIFAAHLYEGCLSRQEGRTIRHEFTRSPLVLP